MHIRSYTVILLVLATFHVTAQTKVHDYDVVVYGGTASGVMAAVAAAREGQSTALIEPTNHVGGMVSSGLGWTDYGKPDFGSVIGGYAREFFTRISDYYGRDKVKKFNQSLDIKLHDNPYLGDIGWYFEPHVAETVFNQMLKDAKVHVYYSQGLKEKNGTVKNGNTLTSLITQKNEQFNARVFIDASYEGDLMAQTGVTYIVGREAKQQYNEPLAGVLAEDRGTEIHHGMEQGIGYRIPAYDANGKLLQGLSNEERSEPGSADKKTQAYNFRLCLTKDKNNLVPFIKPAAYNAADYAVLSLLLKEMVKKGEQPPLSWILKNSPVPNGKTDTNNQGPFSTDYVNHSWDYPEADAATRKKIYNQHVNYQQGLLYFLGYDTSVPINIRNEMNQWGLAKDEFRDNNHWPYQLYVREARRMVGEYVMTQKDVQADIMKTDAIGLGSYAADSHIIQRRVNKNGLVENEGQMFENIVTKPYQIPYRSLVPKSEEANNLLVTVCLSSSHVAYQTIRMEPQFMITGEAAGTAASLAIKGKTSVQGIDIKALKNILHIQQHAVLVY